MQDKLKQQKFTVPYLLKGSRFDEDEIDIIREVLYDDRTLSCGTQRDIFEKEFAEFVGAKYALSLTSCTIALELATYLINFQEGDHVIATPFTYQASTQSLLTLPIEISYCDIDNNSLSASFESISNLINSKTKAIYITHYGGYMGDMDKIMALAKAKNLIVLEDCAHSIGSKYKGRSAGTTADIGCFSFHSSKNISTLGEGGMITFDNDEWYQKIRNIRGNEPDAVFSTNSHKFGNNIHYNSKVERHDKNSYTADCIALTHPGTNSTLSEPAAAVGRVQLTKVVQFNQTRQQIAKFLNDVLSEVEELRIQQVPDHIIHTYHLYNFFINEESKINRDEFIEFLYNSGIEIVLRYFPLHLLPEWRYRGGAFGQCPNAERIWFKELVNLPCYPGLTEFQLNYMIDKIKEGVKRCMKTKAIFYS